MPVGQMEGYDAMKQGLLESPHMPHCETLCMMRIMDELRKKWNVVYPND
ncbi:hypothetical protein [Prevotella heparinolytica]|nr:hypothetical protein [Bacteroides heparinolyticus]